MELAEFMVRNKKESFFTGFLVDHRAFLSRVFWNPHQPKLQQVFPYLPKYSSSSVFSQIFLSGAFIGTKWRQYFGEYSNFTIVFLRNLYWYLLASLGRRWGTRASRIGMPTPSSIWLNKTPTPCVLSYTERERRLNNFQKKKLSQSVFWYTGSYSDN